MTELSGLSALIVASTREELASALESLPQDHRSKLMAALAVGHRNAEAKTLVLEFSEDWQCKLNEFIEHNKISLSDWNMTSFDTSGQEFEDKGGVPEATQFPMRFEFSRNTIGITVKTIGGEALPLSIASSCTINELKDTIQEQLGVTPGQQALVVGKKELKEGGSSLSDHGICDGASVTLIIREEVLAGMEKRLLTLGLDTSGKTTLLYKMKLGETVTTIPTIGFNVEEIQHGNVKFTVWDIGGQDKLRPLWRHYYQATDAIVYVVDSNDRDRVEEAKAELHRMLNEDELRDAALLVYANKQDLPGAMTCSEIADKLGLHTLRNRRWYIQGSCAVSGDGLFEGLDWLHSTLSK